MFICFANSVNLAGQHGRLDGLTKMYDNTQHARLPVMNLWKTTPPCGCLPAPVCSHLGGVKGSKSHQFHHLNLLLCFTLHVLGCQNKGQYWIVAYTSTSPLETFETLWNSCGNAPEIWMGFADFSLTSLRSSSRRSFCLVGEREEERWRRGDLQREQKDGCKDGLPWPLRADA